MSQAITQHTPQATLAAQVRCGLSGGGNTEKLTFAAMDISVNINIFGVAVPMGFIAIDTINDKSYSYVEWTRQYTDDDKDIVERGVYIRRFNTIYDAIECAVRRMHYWQRQAGKQKKGIKR